MTRLLFAMALVLFVGIGAQHKAEIEKWRPMIKAAGIKVQ